MSLIIRFNTAKFDVSKERKNPINEIYGESLLAWLKEKTKNKFNLSDIVAEDWGWVSYVNYNGRDYLLGSSASEEEDGKREWILQIEKSRSFKEKLLGKEKMLDNDECAQFFLELIKGEKDFHDISFE